MSDYYKEKKDIEVAAFLGLIIPLKTESRAQYVMELRYIIGDSPWDYLRNREFANLMLGKGLFVPNGISSTEFLRLLNVLWDIAISKQIPLEYVGLSASGYKRCSEGAYQVLSCIGSEAKAKMKAMTAILTLKDGMGRGIWASLQQEDISCPITRDMRNVLRVFYPLSLNNESTDDVIRFLGFENPSEYIYSYLGYSSLRSAFPREIKHYEDLLRSRFSQTSRFAYLDNRRKYKTQRAVPDIPIKF